MGLPLPENFRAAIEKGVRNIKGKLCPLNPVEKRQLLADLRERGDCPDGWKNRKNMTSKKQQNILKKLHKAIDRLLNPEKVKAANTRNDKKRRENGKAEEYTKKIKENGQAKKKEQKYKESGKRKSANDRTNAKISKATREANARAISENKDHQEPTWDEATLERLATDTVEMIDDRCGDNGFVHVFGGAWACKDLNEAMEVECFGKGRGRHAVFIDGGKFARYRDVSTHVELFAPYSGTNHVNADDLEKRIHEKLIEMRWPQHRRMFRVAGAGTCRGTREAKIPFPYYTGVLVCAQSMEEIGIRLATKKDHASRKRKRQ